MDKLTLLVKTGSIKALSMLMGGQFKKFTTESSSKALPLFYILLRVNMDVIICKKMENIQDKMKSDAT